MASTRRPRWPFGLVAVAGAAGVVLGVLALVTATTALGVLALVAVAVVLAGGAGLLHRPAATLPNPVAEPVPTPPAGPASREIDDLPEFFDRPPGSLPALSAAPASPPAAPPASLSQRGPIGPTVPGSTGASGPARSTRPVVLGLAATAVLVLAVAATLASVGGRTGPAADQRSDGPATRTVPTGRTTGAAAPTPVAPLTAAAAGDLAGTDLAAGSGGFTAQLVFIGIVLEPRAVGVTVTYPRLTLSSDGTRSIAHLEAPTWNCLSPEPPADPDRAGCTRSLTEYADLPGPDLQVTREGGRLRFAGSFATYTRPNGSPATYTGRSYMLTVEATTQPSVTGSLQLGDARSTTTGSAADNRVEFSD